MINCAKIACGWIKHCYCRQGSSSSELVTKLWGIKEAVEKTAPIFMAIIILVFVPSTVRAHGSRADHYNDVARILNGFGTPKYDDAVASVRRVASNNFSPNAAESTIQAEKAYAGFCRVFDQVSGKMDSMPRDLEIKFGLSRGTLSHPRHHRFLCHGWAIDKDPPECVLEFFQMKSGIDKIELLNYWRDYQRETFALVQQYSGLSAERAKAFAGIIWDIHLLGDWTPDNSEVKWLVRIEDISDNLCKNLKTLLGERAEAVSSKVMKFVQERITKKMSTRHIATEMVEWLSRQRIGSEVYLANRQVMKGLWDSTVAVNIKEARATLETQKKIAAIGAEKEAARIAREAKLKKVNSAMASKSQKEVNPLRVVRDMKAQCKEATIAKGVIPESLHPQKGYLLPITYNSGRRCYALVYYSKALRAGSTEGVCAFVISSGIALSLYKYGVMTDDEVKMEIAQAGVASGAVGTITGVSVLLGASPTGPIVLAIGIGGYVLCDMVFEMQKQMSFGVDDILGYMDEDFEDTASFLTIGETDTDTFVDEQGKNSFVDEPETPTFINKGSKGKSFVDFLN